MAWKFEAAGSWPAMSASRAAVSSSVTSGAFLASQQPFRLAASMARRPASVMRPRSSSSTASALFLSDQTLFARRGAKYLR